MITLPTAIWLVLTSVDMRLGMEGLSLFVQERLARSPCAGDAYLFSNKRRNRLKLLCWDGNGVWLCQRRLHRGAFVWQQSAEGVCNITREQWEWLIAGVDWQRISKPPPSTFRV